MNSEKLEKLSLLVTSVIEESGRLKNEIRCLEEKVQEMDRENKAVLEQNQRLLSDLEKLNVLEDCNRKMQEDKSVIRSKVQTILENLEKMDIS
ncbi:MAG: hypothetical protein NPINA01_06240 [Nitrospinaceae bacterium]|nr:MAG: hypothetical protein NPINA01_06240 [Nitrospinaceae bacterium]